MIKELVTACALTVTAMGSAYAGAMNFDYGSALTIAPDGGTSPFTPTVTVNTPGAITDMNVYLEGYSHDSWREVDIVVLLLSEDLSFFEKAVVLRSEFVFDFDTEAVDGLRVVFDDEADMDVPVSGLTSGSFKPTDRWDYIATGFLDPIPVVLTLSELADGLSGERTFALYAYDYFANTSGGSFENWGLEVTFDDADAVPLPGFGAVVGLALAGAIRRRRNQR
ncbi:MAG: hypothetical protein HRU11_11820 [Parvularculaceae bacterium]|nr:hypothetical protein [Parvularculaceae bacterium]